MWVNALESGNYEQSFTLLHQTNGEKQLYCCLGVLCDLYLKNVGDIITEYDEYNDFTYYDGEESVLPEKVKDWVGLTDSAGKINADGVRFNTDESLSGLNDEGFTFKEIAQIIRDNDTLFVND